MPRGLRTIQRGRKRRMEERVIEAKVEEDVKEQNE